MSELIKPKVVTESEAERQIVEAFQEMDLDDLARLYSDVCKTGGPIIIVFDGCEAKTAEEVGADEGIPSSAVYEFGEQVGDLAEDGTICSDCDDDADEAKNQSDKSFFGTDDD